MTRCRSCGGTFDPAELVRHEDAGLVLVHCPDCGRLLGTYNSHHHGG